MNTDSCMSRPDDEADGALLDSSLQSALKNGLFSQPIIIL